MKIKLALPRAIAKAIQTGKNVVVMASEVLTGDPMVAALGTANDNLQTRQADVLAAKSTLAEAYAAERIAKQAQRNAYNDLAAHVQILSGGDGAYINSCGYPVQATKQPWPPVDQPPAGLMTQVNGTPGRVVCLWTDVPGAVLYEVQYTTDLTGATGWVSTPAMTAATKLNVDNLESGTKYAFRVRGCGGKGQAPGPWSDCVQRMAP
jgi:hypothetical protein